MLCFAYIPESNHAVKVPVVHSPKPKMAMSVVGELTTQLNQRITVLPSGKVVVDNKRGSDEDEQTDEDDEGSVDEDVSYKTDKVKAQDGSQTQVQDVNEEESDDEEQMLEDAEEMYLNHYEHEQETNPKSRKRKQHIPKNQGEYDDDQQKHPEQNKAAKKGNDKQLTSNGRRKTDYSLNKTKLVVQLQKECEETVMKCKNATDDLSKHSAKKIKSISKESRLDTDHSTPVDVGKRGKKAFRYFNRK